MELKNTQDAVRRKAHAFMGSAVGRIYVLGTNKYGASIADWFANQGKPIAGFVNDAGTMREFASLSVVRSNELPKDAAVINCIVEGRSIDARKNIDGWQLGPSVDYFALQATFPGLMEIDFMANTSSIAAESDRYVLLHARLADDGSKTTLEKLVNFRYNRDLDFMDGFSMRLAEQYFEPFVTIPEHGVFVDGGGFDGATSTQFAKQYPRYECIWCFEPNEESFANTRRSLAGLRDVHLVRKGVWDRQEVLLFDASLGSASKLSGTGSVRIEATSLDVEVDGRVDFIKLDVEGAEFKALQGAERIIKQHRPKLAVCIYHDQVDFLRIPDLVLGIDPSYQVYLRHYTQGVFETVMYFV